MKRHLLAVTPAFPASPCAYFPTAFERLGWKVTRVSAPYLDHGRELGVRWKEEELPYIHYSLRKGVDWNIDKFIDMATEIEDSTPDLVLIIEETYHNEIKNTTKIPSILWSCDGWQNSFDRIRMIKPTVAYTNHPLGVIPEPQKTTPEGWKFMPAAFAPWVHKNFLIPMAKRPIDFALMATPYGNRPRTCEFLKSQGISVSHGFVNTETYVSIYNNAKMTYHNAGGQAECKFRFYEGAAMGCIQICDENPLLQLQGFYPDVHYIHVDVEQTEHGLWPNLGMLANLVKEVRDDHSRMAHLASSAWFHTLRNHSYYNRALEMMESVNMADGHDIQSIRFLNLRESSGRNPQ